MSNNKTNTTSNLNMYSPEYVPGSPEYRPNTPSGGDTIIPGETDIPEINLPKALDLSKIDTIEEKFAEMFVPEESKTLEKPKEDKDPNYIYYNKYWCSTQKRFIGFILGQNRKNIKRIVSNFKRNSHGVKCRIDHSRDTSKFQITLKIRKGLYDVQLADDYTDMSYFDWIQSHFENIIQDLCKLDDQAFRLVVEGRWKSADGEDEELPEPRPDASDIPRQHTNHYEEQRGHHRHNNRDRRYYHRDRRHHNKERQRHRRDSYEEENRHSYHSEDRRNYHNHQKQRRHRSRSRDSPRM